ncbi:MAG: type I-E CRISPR-associated protein Cas6/Cse3/CasE [Christensenellaceae bacterium]|jgi:CRISPR system Cascade subunit CasE|nr:type I-E CRISPR-associated protein Cas6/Cse3/CasE [Christensenellaceae bacterium]
MYITQIKLNNSRGAAHALASPQVMHAIVESCFEGSSRNLWRVDKTSLLIVSVCPPSNPQAARQLGGLPVTKDYAPYLAAIADDRNYCFRLCANAVQSKPQAHGQRGKVAVCATSDAQREWMQKKAEKHGFVLDAVEITESNVVQFRRQNAKVTLQLTTFEGILTVQDHIRLVQAMTEGIGRAKAYGAGLLTVM